MKAGVFLRQWRVYDHPLQGWEGATICGELSDIVKGEGAGTTNGGMGNGSVNDYVETLLFEARTSGVGVVLYLCAVPSIRKGETIASVGVLARGEGAIQR